MRNMRILHMSALSAFLLAVTLEADIALAAPSGAIYTTNKGATIVNANVQYTLVSDVYLSGGPQNVNAAGLTDGTYYFQVTDPSGKVLLSTDNAVCRKVSVVGGRVVAPAGLGICNHLAGTPNPANGVTPVQLAPFSATPNQGGEYKAWAVPVGDAAIGSDPKTLIFSNSNAKTDNFKINSTTAVPEGSCAPSSSLSVLVSGTNVISYVPKGSWSGGATGIKAVNVEGASIVNTTIATTKVVNSCASNPVTGTTVCTANNTDVYLLSGTTLTSTLTSSGSGLLSFSGGVCTNCGVMMDAVHNKAVIGLSVAGVGGFQFLNLATSVFEPAFKSMAPAGAFGKISEDPLIDPIRNILLSANENNNYEIIDVATSTTPVFYERPITGTTGLLDSSGAECSTGIILAPSEFSGPSQVFIANLSSTSASFVAGAPGSWTAPSQVKSLTGSLLAAGASGIAVAQGTHTGVVTGEFGGDAVTAIALPTVIDTSAAVPDISAWMTCRIGGGFLNGLDPHTVTAYTSPTTGNAIALLANNGATLLARIDLTLMLALPETFLGSHVCAAGTLPASVVTLLPI